MIEGIPDKVSTAKLSNRFTLLVFFAYSSMYIAVNIPIGSASANENAINIIVVIREGIRDTFSLVYCRANKEGLICGRPITRM